MHTALQVTDLDGIEALLGGACCLVYLLLFLVWIYVCVWVYRDAENRGSSGALWVIVLLFLGLLGLIIWFVVRPPLRQQYPYYQQPYVQAPPAPTAPVCPSCGSQMAYVPQYAMWYCNLCQRYQQPGAQAAMPRDAVKIPCPYCGTMNLSTDNRCGSCGGSMR